MNILITFFRLIIIKLHKILIQIFMENIWENISYLLKFKLCKILQEIQAIFGNIFQKSVQISKFVC